MTITRTQLMVRAARRIGAYTGTVTTGSTPANNAVLGGMLNVGQGDDSWFEARLLIFPDATAEADKERLIREWNDAEGKAHFDVRSTDADMPGENFIVMPRDSYNLAELRDALNVCLRETKRTYRHTLPLYPGQQVVPLTPLIWLRGDSDVDAIWVGESPSLLHNPAFELWQNGDSAAPDGWTLDGVLATVARATGGLRSSYAAAITRTTNDATLYQSVLPPYLQHITRSQNANLPEVNGIALVTVGTASRMRVGIYNGSTTTYSSYAAGTASLPEFLTVSYQTTATDTDLRLVVSVDSGDVTGTVHYADLVALDDFPTALRDYGPAGYYEWLTGVKPRNRGGVPVVEFTGRPGAKQLITYSRRAFAAMDADSDEVDDHYAEAVEAGMVAKLLQIHKPNQDRTRIDEIQAEEESRWKRLTQNFIDLPVPNPPYQQVVWSA